MQPDKKIRKPLKKKSRNRSLQIQIGLDVTAEVDAKGNYCKRTLKETVYDYLDHLMRDDSLGYEVVALSPDTEVAPWKI